MRSNLSPLTERTVSLKSEMNSSVAITSKRCHGGGEVSYSLPPKRARNMFFTETSLLPELVIEILLRLPVKSLLRLRCVCRAWKLLISDSFFVKKHLYLSKTDFQFDRSRCLISDGAESEDPFNFKSYPFSSIFGISNQETFTDSTDIDYPSKDPTRCDWVVGSCDGLICISIRQDTIILLNPTLRQSKMLPSLGFKKREGSYTVYGFGYDASVGDYKVVRIFCYQAKDFHHWYETIVRVYSLRTNTWRRIQGFPYGDPSDEAGKHVNGTLNWWVVQRVGAELVWNIMSLDLAAETYMEILQPDYENGVSNKMLGVLGGSLCVLGNRLSSHADVWVMREYGVRESWTKLLSIPYIDREPALFGAPLMIAENGQVLLQCGTKLYLYNAKDRTFRIAMVIGDVLSNFEPTMYMETLVSPAANNWL